MLGVTLYRPMPLVRLPEAFDHRDWLYELKHDGFRALAYVEGHLCGLVSRRGHTLTKFTLLSEEIARGVRTMSWAEQERQAIERVLLD
jgi:ATP-dependent DNA ligase